MERIADGVRGSCESKSGEDMMANMEEANQRMEEEADQGYWSDRSMADKTPEEEGDRREGDVTSPMEDSESQEDQEGSWTHSTDSSGLLGPGDFPTGPPGLPHVHHPRQVSQHIVVNDQELTTPPMEETTTQGTTNETEQEEETDASPDEPAGATERTKTGEALQEEGDRREGDVTNQKEEAESQGSWTLSADSPGLLGPGGFLRGPPGLPHVHHPKQVSHQSDKNDTTLTPPPPTEEDITQGAENTEGQEELTRLASTGREEDNRLEGDVTKLEREETDAQQREDQTGLWTHSMDSPGLLGPGDFPIGPPGLPLVHHPRQVSQHTQLSDPQLTRPPPLEEDHMQGPNSAREQEESTWEASKRPTRAARPTTTTTEQDAYALIRDVIEEAMMARSWNTSADGPGMLGPGANHPRGPPGPPQVHYQEQVSQNNHKIDQWRWGQLT